MLIQLTDSELIQVECYTYTIDADGNLHIIGIDDYKLATFAAGAWIYIADEAFRLKVIENDDE